MMVSGINHITLKTSDINREEEFYINVLGLKKVGQRAHMRFYSSGCFNHEIALIQDAFHPKSNHSSLVHVCFNVSDKTNLYTLYKHCQDMGQQTSELINHTIMHSFYLQSPEGYTIEIGVDRPKEEWEDHSSPFEHDTLLLN